MLPYLNQSNTNQIQKVNMKELTMLVIMWLPQDVIRMEYLQQEYRAHWLFLELSEISIWKRGLTKEELPMLFLLSQISTSYRYEFHCMKNK